MKQDVWEDFILGRIALILRQGECESVLADSLCEHLVPSGRPYLGSVEPLRDGIWMAEVGE